jgi:hypothetical protein
MEWPVVEPETLYYQGGIFGDGWPEATKLPLAATELLKKRAYHQDTKGRFTGRTGRSGRKDSHHREHRGHGGKMRDEG